MTIGTITLTNTFNDWVNATNALIAISNNLGPYNSINIVGGSISNVGLTNATITDGVMVGSAIDSSVIGANVPAAAYFTDISGTGNVNLEAATLIFGTGQISGNYVSGGTITNVTVELAADPTANNQAANKHYVDNILGTHTFGVVAVSGQTSVDAGIAADTLNLIAGSGITLTTDAMTNSVTITVGALSTVPIINGGTGATTASGARTNLGLGDLAVLGTINNDQWSGTPLSVANGGTGSSTPPVARTNLGMGAANAIQLGSIGLGVIAPTAAGNIQMNATASFASEVANGTKTAAFNIDWTVAQKQSVVLGASSLTMTFSNPLGPAHFQLKLIQDGTGSRVKGVWPTIKTSGGGSSSWVLSTTANSVDILNLYYDGTSWYGLLSNNWS